VSMISRLRSLWRARQRKLDLQLLWPTCREQAKTLEEAKIAFGFHANHDPAWQELGSAQIARVIDELD
jgi:hypothetical protein